jgi:hypothetical protein
MSCIEERGPVNISGLWDICRLFFFSIQFGFVVASEAVVRNW